MTREVAVLLPKREQLALQLPKRSHCVASEKWGGRPEASKHGELVAAPLTTESAPPASDEVAAQPPEEGGLGCAAAAAAGEVERMGEGTGEVANSAGTWKFLLGLPRAAPLLLPLSNPELSLTHMNTHGHTLSQGRKQGFA